MINIYLLCSQEITSQLKTLDHGVEKNHSSETTYEFDTFSWWL